MSRLNAIADNWVNARFVSSFGATFWLGLFAGFVVLIMNLASRSETIAYENVTCSVGELKVNENGSIGIPVSCNANGSTFQTQIHRGRLLVDVINAKPEQVQCSITLNGELRSCTLPTQ